MSEKPEWFQITEGDDKPAEPKSKSSRLKIVAIALPLIVVGAFAVGANGDEDDEVAPQISSSTMASTSNSDASSTSENTKKVTAAIVSNPQKQNSMNVAKSVSAPASTAPVKPGIGVPAPSINGKEDDHDGFFGGDDEDEGSEHEGRERHKERGEHENRGAAPKIPQSGSSTTKN
jgi:hypothetical protein